MKNEMIAFLRSTPLFAALSAGDVETLAMALTTADYPAGHVFAKQGQRGDAVFLVVTGEVQVTTGQGTRALEINRLHAGELFGLVALIDDEPRSASCIAGSPCRVAALPRGAASLLFNQAAPIGYVFQKALATQLARDLRHLDDELRRLLLAHPSSPNAPANPGP